MADLKNLKQAKQAYNTLCSMLDNRQWKYSKNEEDLSIECRVQGDDIPMNIFFQIDTDHSLIILYSHLDVEVPKEKLVETAVAVNIINSVLVDGSFDYNILKGNILFRLTSSYKSSLISEKAFEYILDVSCSTVDQYNDKLDALIKGEYSLSDLYILTHGE